MREPSNLVDLSKLPAPIPWSVPIPRGVKGVAPGQYDYTVLPVFGNMAVASFTTPALVDNEIRQLYGQLGDDPMATIIPGLKNRFPLRPGPRGVGLLTAYTTWHGHTSASLRADGTLNHDKPTTNPHVPWWVGIVVNGQIAYAMRDGSVQYPYKVPLKTYSYDFTFYEPHRTTTFVVDTGVGEVLKVDRDGTSFTTTPFASGFGKATSIRGIGHKLYIADAAGGAIWELDALTKNRRKVCTMPHVWWLDSTSDGDLVAMKTDCSIRRVDPATGAIGPNINAVNTTPQPGKEWVQCSVDKFGTFGPVDAVLACTSHGVGNVDVWRFNKAGEKIHFLSGGGNLMSSGPARYCHEAAGHYPWIAEHHPSDACAMFQGYGNLQPNIFAVRNPSLPAQYPYVHALANTARDLIRWGGANKNTFPVDGKPSLTAMINPAGWSMLGCSADYIAQMSYQDAAAYIRGGMVGKVPYPFNSPDMKALLYFLYYNSQRHLLEGAALIEGLIALPSV